MKEHNFIVIGTEDKDGKIHFDIDPEVEYAFPDGYIWDTETEEWSTSQSDEDTDRDDRISSALHAKLYGPIIR